MAKSGEVSLGQQELAKNGENRQSFVSAEIRQKREIAIQLQLDADESRHLSKLL